MKICTLCGEEKPLSHFYRSKAKDTVDRYAYSSRCKPCTKIYWVERGATPKITPENKICPRCKVEKPSEQFSTNPRAGDGLAHYCTPCGRAMKKYARNKELAHSPKKLKVREMISSARKRAKRDNVPIDIDHDYVMNLATDICPALGIPISYTNSGHLKDNSATLDKFDAERGYVKGNVNIISRLANIIKTSATANQVRHVADWMETITQ